jgi:hypothetical protein
MYDDMQHVGPIRSSQKKEALPNIYGARITGGKLCSSP